MQKRQGPQSCIPDTENRIGFRTFATNLRDPIQPRRRHEAEPADLTLQGGGSRPVVKLHWRPQGGASNHGRRERGCSSCARARAKICASDGIGRRIGLSPAFFERRFLPATTKASARLASHLTLSPKRLRPPPRSAPFGSMAQTRRLMSPNVSSNACARWRLVPRRRVRPGACDRLALRVAAGMRFPGVAGMGSDGHLTVLIAAPVWSAPSLPPPPSRSPLERTGAHSGTLRGLEALLTKAASGSRKREKRS